MANMTVTTLADHIPTIVAARALGALKANTVMTRLVARNWDTDVATKGRVISIPYPGALSANDKAADTAVTLQAPADGAYTCTLDKHKEVSFLIEDPARAMAAPDVLMQTIDDAVVVIAEAMDGDLTALYAGLSQSVTATAGLGEDDFREARRQLNSAKAPLRNRAAVLHEDAEYELYGIEKFVSQDYRELQTKGEPGDAQLDAYVKHFMGFDVYMDQQIKVATTVVQNLFFHKNAFVLATRPLPPAPEGMGVVQTVMDEDGVGLRVTMSYNADHLGVQVTIDVLYGVAELRDNHGVVVTTTEI